QDTQKEVIDIFLNHIKIVSQKHLSVGFFGDKMQSIYESGVGNIESYVINGKVIEIKKDDNYRSSINVIKLLNNLRSDIQQKPAKMTKDYEIGNKEGKAIFIYSQNEFDFTTFKKSKFTQDWDCENHQETRILFLTHKLN